MEKFINFNYLFGKAKGSIAKYKGEPIYMTYWFNLKGKHTLKFKLIKMNDSAERALLINTGRFTGKIYNEFNKRIKKPRGIYGSLDIWGNDWKKNKEIILKIDLSDGSLGIENGVVKKFGETSEYISAGGYWFAMKKEQISPTTIRFYCNDTDHEDDFDDLIFDLEILD